MAHLMAHLSVFSGAPNDEPKMNVVRFYRRPLKPALAHASKSSFSPVPTVSMYLTSISRFLFIPLHLLFQNLTNFTNGTCKINALFYPIDFCQTIRSLNIPLFDFDFRLRLTDPAALRSSPCRVSYHFRRRQICWGVEDEVEVEHWLVEDEVEVEQ